MKKKVNNAQYNRNLFIILVVAAVVICSVVAAVYLLFVKDTDKNNQTDIPSVSEGNITDIIPEDNPQEPATDDSSDDTAETPADNNADSDLEDAEKTDDEKQEDTSDDWMLVLANPWNSIPDGFTVELKDIGGGHSVDARIADDLNAMMNDLAKEGLSAIVCSSYRNNDYQTMLYNREVNNQKNLGYSDEDAAIEAAKWVAIPGTSEHQTGLAIDIMSIYYMVLDEGQEDTAEQQWLMDNSWRYGFILRYPSDKSDITGIYYEPWHYRYVGKDAAKEIYDRGICFEEYLAT